LPFDAIVLAVPPPQLAYMLGTPERFGLTALDRYATNPIVDVHLWHDRGRLGFDFAALLDSPVQWIFEKGPGYICCSMSAATTHISVPTAEIVRRCWDEVVASVSVLAGAALVRSALTRNPEATFTARPGVRRPGPATSLSNVTVAGSWTDTGWPDTMESAVRSGRAAARHIANSLQGARVA
jgi:hypothetical protein